jgi:hypothetical protein
LVIYNHSRSLGEYGEGIESLRWERISTFPEKRLWLQGAIKLLSTPLNKPRKAIFSARCTGCVFILLQGGVHLEGMDKKNVENHAMPPGIAGHRSGNSDALMEIKDIYSAGTLFSREIYLVMLGLNPLNIQVKNFNDIISQIQDSTPPQQVADLVGQALQHLYFYNISQELLKWKDAIVEFHINVFKGDHEYLKRNIQDYSKYFPGIEPSKYTIGLETRRINTILKVSDTEEVKILERYCIQLNDYYPRFRSILCGNKFLDYILGNAAGFFGGGSGAIGASIWDDWSGKSDDDFIKIFSNAVKDFIEKGRQFTRNIEKTFEPVLDQYFNDESKRDRMIYDGLERGCREGVDIDKILHHLTHPQRPDAGHIALYDIVIENLRKKSMTAKVERNIRISLGI